jgi:hypothetical protein
MTTYCCVPSQRTAEEVTPADNGVGFRAGAGNTRRDETSPHPCKDKREETAVMLDLTRTTPTVNELRQRMAAITDDKRAVERDLTGGIDPREIAILCAAADCLTSAQQALVFATCALTAGDKERAQKRLNVCDRALEEAAGHLATVENGTWQEVE